MLPGDPGCSPLVSHLQPEGDALQMPPGSPLVDEELCAVRAWIADGAAR